MGSDVFTADPSKGQHEPLVKLCAGEIESILCSLGRLSCRDNKVRGTVVLHTRYQTKCACSGGL